MKDLAVLQTQAVVLLRRIGRHHVIIILVLVITTLAYAVYAVNAILATPSDQAYTNSQQLTLVNGSFDKKTIEKIDQLTDRQQNTTLNLPSGMRINPFAE